jgi:hypothetical protein
MTAAEGDAGEEGKASEGTAGQAAGEDAHTAVQKGGEEGASAPANNSKPKAEVKNTEDLPVERTLIVTLTQLRLLVAGKKNSALTVVSKATGTKITKEPKPRPVKVSPSPQSDLVLECRLPANAPEPLRGHFSNLSLFFCAQEEAEPAVDGEDKPEGEEEEEPTDAPGSPTEVEEPGDEDKAVADEEEAGDAEEHGSVDEERDEEGPTSPGSAVTKEEVRPPSHLSSRRPITGLISGGLLLRTMLC